MTVLVYYIDKGNRHVCAASRYSYIVCSEWPCMTLSVTQLEILSKLALIATWFSIFVILQK